MKKTRITLDRQVPVQQMLEAALTQGQIIEPVLARVGERLPEALPSDEIRKFRKIILTGCGDSHFAGLASRLFFSKYTGLGIEAVEAMEFSRYETQFTAPDTLVIIVSNSGLGSRLAEAARAAKKYSVPTLAITGNPEGRLAHESSRILLQTAHDQDKLPTSLGATSFRLGNYLASLVALKLTALHIGSALGHISETTVRDVKEEILRATEIITRTHHANLGATEKYAEKIKHQNTYFILGAGPSFGTAMFCSAKFIEMPQYNGVAQQLEEWAHEQYFLTREHTQVCLILPPGLSRDRGLEQIHGVRDMGGDAVVVGDVEDEELAKNATQFLPIVGQLPEELTGLTYFLPLQLLAMHVCQALGKPAFDFISDDQWLVNARQINESEIQIP